ncbi:hypothetical protein ASG43_06315 [Aureimonas sp. Leaf454]|uniref:DUF4169 family protein n=1 Tax=Aureimonas sp. Leaf454 TaxID=1736381 RepID=UPI0006FD781D|nr:DUF4169 family protein [Aureimonas sp. Leaf454]KQT50869.1 hypothetical protein ASG43_06315 [Aureimonas sp. Leaf454]
MGEVVNLRLQRKRAARRVAETLASEQRLLHGLPKTLRQTARREAETAAERLEGHRLDAGVGDDRPGVRRDGVSPDENVDVTTRFPQDPPR